MDPNRVHDGDASCLLRRPDRLNLCFLLDLIACAVPAFQCLQLGSLHNKSRLTGLEQQFVSYRRLER